MFQFKRAGEDQEKQNKEFQMEAADQRETRKLLTAVLSVLQYFCGKRASSASRAQRREPVCPPPPPGFEAYKNSAASGGVVSLIQQIISDAKAMEAETIQANSPSTSPWLS